MAQESCLQATVSELFNKWLHRECITSNANTRFMILVTKSSRVTQQLWASVMRRRRYNASVFCLNKKSLPFQVSELKKTSSGTSRGTMTRSNWVWSLSDEPSLTSINYSSKHKPDSLWSFPTTLNCNIKPVWLSQQALWCVNRIQRAHFVLKSILVHHTGPKYHHDCCCSCI